MALKCIHGGIQSYMAARKSTATLLAFSRTCTPGLTSTHQLKRKKIRKTIHCMVKFTPTVILPGRHRMDWKKCSAPQRTLDRMTFRSLWWPPFLYTPGQPDFPYLSPASKNRIQGAGLLHPITTRRKVIFLWYDFSSGIWEEFARATRTDSTIQLSAQVKTACLPTLWVFITPCSWEVSNAEAVSYHSDALRKDKKFILKNKSLK